jgi:hypothetical protein
MFPNQNIEQFLVSSINANYLNISYLTNPKILDEYHKPTKVNNDIGSLLGYCAM